MMRRLVAGAGVLLVLTASVAARPKKKKKKKDDTTETKKGGGDEIEMDNPEAGSASTPDTPPPATTATAEVSATATTPPPAATDVPLAIDDRPLTLPKSKLDVHGGLPIIVVPSIDNNNVKTSSAAEGFTVGATYGIDDKAEVGADYSFSINPADIKGLFAVHGAYSVLHDAKMDLAVSGALEVQPVTVVTLDMAMMPVTSTSAALALEVGAWFRYHVAPKISVFSGLPALPHAGASLSRQGIPLPPVGYQLNLGLNGGGPISLGLPVGIGYQAAPNIYAFAATNLANIKIANTVNQFLFVDFIPLAIGGYYAMPKLDIGATFADDLKQPGSYLSFSIIARYFVK